MPNVDSEHEIKLYYFKLMRPKRTQLKELIYFHINGSVKMNIKNNNEFSL